MGTELKGKFSVRSDDDSPNPLVALIKSEKARIECTALENCFYAHGVPRPEVAQVVKESNGRQQ